MAYSLSPTNSIKCKLEDDLKGSVDFDFFATEGDAAVSSNNNAMPMAILQNVENQKSKEDFQKIKNISPKAEDQEAGTPCPSPARQPPPPQETLNQTDSRQSQIRLTGNKEVSSSNKIRRNPPGVVIPPLRIPSPSPPSGTIHMEVSPPQCNNMNSPTSSNYSSPSTTSLSRSESLPASSRSGSESHSPHSHTAASGSNCTRSPSPVKFRTSDSRPRSPSPTPRSQPLSSASDGEEESDISATDSTDLPSKLKAGSAADNNYSAAAATATGAEESDISSDESDVTDVSPLSSPNTVASPVMSPRGSGNSHPRRPPIASSSTGKQQQHLHQNQHHAATGAEDPDRLDLETIMRTILQLDKERRGGTAANTGRRPESAMTRGGSANSRNRSFSAERCRNIDSENQRLLTNLMGTSSSALDGGGSKQSSSGSMKVSPPSVYRRPTSSALNRQRQQRKIEDENKAILRRINNVRPTRGITRTEQLHQYDKIMHGGSGPPSVGVDGKFCKKRSNPSGGNRLLLGSTGASIAGTAGSTQSHRPATRSGSSTGLLPRSRSVTSLDRMNQHSPLPLDDDFYTATAASLSAISRLSPGNGGAVTTAWPMSPQSGDTMVARQKQSQQRPASASASGRRSAGGRATAGSSVRTSRKQRGVKSSRPDSRLDSWPQGW